MKASDFYMIVSAIYTANAVTQSESLIISGACLLAALLLLSKGM